MGRDQEDSVMHRHLGLLVAVALSACAFDGKPSAPPKDASQSFMAAINSKDLSAAMSHWSDDAQLLFIRGRDSGALSREQIQESYQRLFEEEGSPRLNIVVGGTEVDAGEAREWGLFYLGRSAGCYVLIRRASDDWKIYREWIVEPCVPNHPP